MYKIGNFELSIEIIKKGENNLISYTYAHYRCHLQPLISTNSIIVYE